MSTEEPIIPTEVQAIETNIQPPSSVIEFQSDKTIDLSDLTTTATPILKPLPIEPPKPIKKPVYKADESPERNKLILRLDLQKKHFPDVYKSVMASYDDIKHIPTEELKPIPDELQKRISSHNSISISKTIVVAGCSALEMNAHYVGWDLEGLTNVVSNPDNKEMDTIFKELACKYPYGIEGMPPELKLVAHLGTTCYSLNAYNRQQKKQKLEALISETQKTKYTEL